MLGELSHRNKENIHKSDLSSKEGPGLMQATISALKEDIVTLHQDKMSIQREWLSEVQQLKLQVNEYKKKLAMVTDKYLLQTFTKQKGSHNTSSKKDNDQLLREAQILFQQQKDKCKHLEDEIRRQIDENAKLRKQVGILKIQKEKSMEISLIEKIDLEEKNNLLQQQVKSKKNIIQSLKKELDKIYSQKQDLNKKERVIEQKSKELDCYSKEINEYNRLNELRLRQQIGQLGKQNSFLKQYVKKVQKMAKKQCDCESKDEKVRQNLYEIKRQLALAKVKLSQTYQGDCKNKKKPVISDSSSQQESYSFERRKK